MRLRVIHLVPLCLLAEVLASLWIWSRAPTDSIRVFYGSYWAFEVGRLYYWIVVALSIALISSMVGYFSRKRNASSWLMLIPAVLLEIVTSAIYWRSRQSSPLRQLFQSAWAWHRIPGAADMEWPSLEIYLRVHFIAWAIVVTVALIVLARYSRRGRQRMGVHASVT